MKERFEPLESFGPEYTVGSAKLERYRRAGAISREYGEAVLETVRSLQRSALMRAPVPLPPPYKGTSRKIGESILSRVRGKQASALALCPSHVRRSRTPQQWQAAYAAAMAERREAAAAAVEWKIAA